MDPWADRSPQNREQDGAEQPQRASGAQRRVEHEPHRWRRSDRAATPAQWEVAEFYESFDSPRA